MKNITGLEENPSTCTNRIPIPIHITGSKHLLIIYVHKKKDFFGLSERMQDDVLPYLSLELGTKWIT